MLSLDTRMVGLHVHPDSELAPTRSVSSNPLLMMGGYSPITPVNLKAAFDYDANILLESAMLRIDSQDAYDQARRASSEAADGSLDLDFGNMDPLPALSTGDSCSDAHSPATSWADDSLARSSPDPPAYELAPLEWDQFGFAAPLVKDTLEWAETGNSAASHPSQQQHLHGLYPDRSNPIFGGLDQKPLASIKVPATNLTCSTSSNPAVIASFPLEAPFGTTTTQSAAGHTMYSSAGAGENAASPAERAALFEYASLSTGGLVGHVGGRHVSSTGLPPLSVYRNSSPAAGTVADPRDQRQHQVAYPYLGPDAGVSSVSHDRSPLYPLPDPQRQSVQPHQQQQQQQLHLQPQQHGYNVGAAQGFVPVQFTTVTGVTYAVAIPVAATQQAAAIETPHGTYFFVPSAQSQNLAPGTSAQPPNVPLGMLPTPPPTHEANVPVPPECLPSLPPPPLSFNQTVEEKAEPCAHITSAKPRSSPRSTTSPTAKVAKSRGEGLRPEASLREAEKQQDRVGPAKSSNFQLPQGPSAAAIAAENAVKAAALVAALGPAHKIRLPVGQGKRGSTKRKHESPGKKASSRRFTCPHPGCGRGFARNFNMQSHYKSHLGVREYDCLWCNKKFSRRHDRARHCVTVHDAVVDREGTISGPHPVMERNKGKTSIKVEDDVMYYHGGEGHDVLEGEHDLDHHHVADVAGCPGSPEERDPGEHRQSASASPCWG